MSWVRAVSGDDIGQAPRRPAGARSWGFLAGVALLLAAGCTSGGGGPAGAGSTSSSSPDAAASDVAAVCPHAPSPSTHWTPSEGPASGKPWDGTLEYQGLSAGGQFWVLVTPSKDPLEPTVHFAAEGSGRLFVEAVDEQDNHIAPASLDYLQGGIIGWTRPGFQYDGKFELPHEGCWALKAIRGDPHGSVWLDVTKSA
jgi:hypothetical protein